MNSIDHKKRDAGNVGQMFSRIAARYDLLNHILSFGLDRSWRKRVAEETAQTECRRILDVCTGSGDMAIELCRFWKGKARIDGLDFSRELVQIGKKKVESARLQNLVTFSEGNAESLPYQDGQFDAITITFGLRNVHDRLKALQEFYRVAKQGGCFVCLEFSQPVSPIFSRLYYFYLMKLAPFVSGVLGSDPAAYRYLGNTIRDFPTPKELVTLIQAAGWKEVTYKRLAGGIVAIHRGRK